jgi:cyclopropane fatty-acyl-phospholipid synthase-like methyltransferase
MSPRRIQGPEANFSEDFERPQTEADLLVEREVYGAATGIHGYSTVAQADELAERLSLRRGVRLLDIGAGRGWPGLYLAKTTGCEVVLTDLPLAALRNSLARAKAQRVHRRSSVLLAAGSRLPFRPSVFDAITHTDTL